jgi:hypothetical protein
LLSVGAMLKNLHNLGSRKIGFLSTLSLECLSPARVVVGGLTRECFEDINNGAIGCPRFTL